MIDICSQFADDYCITFNSKKSMCIKFGEKLRAQEKVILKNTEISWVTTIKHLGNYLNTTLTDEIDCRMKMSSFIGHVNKLNANFGHLQNVILCKLFKMYCCSFYGSQIWRVNSIYFDRVCVAWNKGVRRVLNVPYNTHTWMLGPLMHQLHLRYQLQRRTVNFLHCMSISTNIIVKTCYTRAICNATTPIGCNLAFIRNYYGKLKPCPVKLNTHRLNVIKELEALILDRSDIHQIDGFSRADINDIIAVIATQ